MIRHKLTLVHGIEALCMSFNRRTFNLIHIDCSREVTGPQGNNFHNSLKFIPALSNVDNTRENARNVK